MTRAWPRLRRFGLAPLFAASTLVVQACVEEIGIVEPDGEARVLLRLRPELSATLANTPESLRIGGFEFEVRNDTTGDVLFDGRIDLDPGAGEPTVGLDLPYPADEPPALSGFVRLMGESGRVEWSGRFGPAIPMGAEEPWELPVQMGRGDLPNLEITGLTVSAVPEAEPPEATPSVPAAVGDGFVEGGRGQAVAQVEGGPAVPALFWGSRTPTILTVDQVGQLVTHLPGTGEVVVAAEFHSASVSVEVLQRVVGVQLVPSEIEVDALGVEAEFAIVALDPRGEPVLGRSAEWIGAAGVVESLGDGLFRSVGPGTGVVKAVLNGLEATGTVRVAQVIRAFEVEPTTLDFTALEEELPLVARATDRNGFVVPGAAAAWSSTDPGVVTVSGAGPGAGSGGSPAAVGEAEAVARSVGNGLAELHVSVEAFSATISVRVFQVPDAIEVIPETT